LGKEKIKPELCSVDMQLAEEIKEKIGSGFEDIYKIEDKIERRNAKQQLLDKIKEEFSQKIEKEELKESAITEAFLHLEEEYVNRQATRESAVRLVA